MVASKGLNIWALELIMPDKKNGMRINFFIEERSGVLILFVSGADQKNLNDLQYRNEK